MRCFAAHTAHYSRCEDPCRVYITDGTLCERSYGYARDITQYVYSKNGKTYSVIDRSATDARVQIEIPAKYNAIRGLLRVISEVLKIRGPVLKSVVTHDRTYHVPDRGPLPDRRDEYIIKVATRRKKAESENGRQPGRRNGNKLIKVTPQRREESRNTKDGDRRQKKNKKERYQRRKKQDKPVIVYVKSRRGKPYHC
jgi:hypothetical protein